MEVLKPRAALLSNLEVLHHLKSVSKDTQAVVQANAFKSSREYETRKDGVERAQNEAEKGFEGRTGLEDASRCQLEVIQYLSQPCLPTTRQNPSSTSKLIKDLKTNYPTLTKAEILQIVNLGPTKNVDLYVIVEELSDRLPSVTSIDALLSSVSSSLTTLPSSGEDHYEEEYSHVGDVTMEHHEEEEEEEERFNEEDMWEGGEEEMGNEIDEVGES